IGLLCGVGLKKLEISSMIIISSIITLPWLSHLIADFRFVTLQGNGFEIVMSFVLWVKYRERVGLWFE
ncbi:MAG: hypothetical protein ACXACW_12425, partial [Candidatus Hodarchaeales archaeon]